MASQTTFVSEFNELLKRIEHILQEARRLPLTHRVLVDEEELRTLLNQIGHVLPEEMRQARWIVQERDKILAQAAQDAEQMREEARQDTAARAAESPWVQEAQVMAQKIIEEAKEHAHEIRSSGRQYLDDQLGRLESRLQDMLETVQANRDELRR